MTTGTTARLALDLLEPGQAQKELFHNEALVTLDMGVQASVLAAGINVPPAAPVHGQCWIVGAAPTGAWSGRALALAGWTAGGWRFIGAREGMTAWDETRLISLRFSGGAWEAGTVRANEIRIDGERVVGPRVPGIAAPVGGEAVDANARTAIAAILDALRVHGLIGS